MAGRERRSMMTGAQAAHCGSVSAISLGLPVSTAIPEAKGTLPKALFVGKAPISGKLKQRLVNEIESITMLALARSANTGLADGKLIPGHTLREKAANPEMLIRYGAENVYDEETGMKLPEKIVVYGSFQSHVGAVKNDSNSELTRMYYIGDNTYTLSVVIPFAGTYDYSISAYGTLSATYQADGYPRSGSSNKAYFTTRKDNTVVRFRYQFISNKVTIEMFE